MSNSVDPRISVVIPSYNHAAFIGQAIESVLSNGTDDIELIVADDASKDLSREILANYRDRDSRLKVIELANNRGPSVALNTGILASRGEYIAVLGSDDFLLAGSLAKQLRFLETNVQYDAIFGMPRLVDESGQPFGIGYGEFAHEFVGRAASRAEWLRRFFHSGNCLCHPTLMLRRRVHDAVGMYDPRLLNLQDFDLWIRMLAAGHSLFVLSDELTARRVRKDRQNLSAPTTSSILRSSFEYLQILKTYRGIPAAYLYEVFSREIRTAGIPHGLSAGELLAEIGARSQQRLLQLFGLESLYEELGTKSNADPARLFRLAGRIDPLAVLPRQPTQAQMPSNARARPREPHLPS